MKQQIIDILRESKILDFTNRKYKSSKPVKQVVITDPYYRFSRIIEEVHNIIPPNKGNWLDLGCHHGQFLELAGKILHYKTTGMDDWDLKTDMPFTDFNYFKVDLSVKQWTELVESKSFQVVSALEVIEHMIDTIAFLQNCKSVMADNGYLVLSTPNINSLRNRIIVPLGKYPAYMEFTNIIHHVRLFNVKAIRTLLIQNGFKVIKVVGVSFLPEKLLKYEIFEKLSKKLSAVFPSLCGELIVIAQKL